MSSSNRPSHGTKKHLGSHNSTGTTQRAAVESKREGFIRRNISSSSLVCEPDLERAAIEEISDDLSDVLVAFHCTGNPQSPPKEGTETSLLSIGGQFK
ncbi:hypothetical protein B0T14DRAFT_606883 [Immersiella caudata]|uniref:Uncharacterized protein n=1 Tax=Immersiella caudata TaxID=314043 RepID=A0AA40BUZ2_9PEZI|nr:hypothetical protein B0T14DRAFT_606883 [Immersiella caudata]